MPVNRERKEREGKRLLDADDSKSRKAKWGAVRYHASGSAANELFSSVVPHLVKKDNLLIELLARSSSYVLAFWAGLSKIKREGFLCSLFPMSI
jgi:hypothetical protein